VYVLQRPKTLHSFQSDAITEDILLKTMQQIANYDDKYLTVMVMEGFANPPLSLLSY